MLSNGVRPGVVGLVRSLATQLGPEGITVNRVAPGFTATERVTEIVAARAGREQRSPEEVEAGITAQIPVGRMGAPEEQAAVVAFLASARAGFLTGQTIVVDGGQHRGLL